MTEFMSVKEALRYFGIAYLGENDPIPQNVIDQLDTIAIEHDLDIRADNRGNITGIDPMGSREALFEEHRKKVGHRPDNPVKMAEAITKESRKEEKQREEVSLAKERLKIKVEKNGG